MSKRSIDDPVNYWTAKNAKLAEQFAEGGISQNEKDRPIQIFNGIHIYVNGYTVPPAEELKNLIVRHGGVYSVFLSSSITHMITNNLPDSKMKLLKRVKVVKPEWVTDSIRRGNRLPCGEYLTVNPFKEMGRIVQGTHSEDSEVGVALERDKCDTRSVPLKQASCEVQGAASNQGATLGADVDSFYNKSRLHFLSTMKMELKNYVNNLRGESNHCFLGIENLKNWLKEKNKGKEPMDWKMSTDYSLAEPGNVIMHLDMDCFFASVSRCGRPNLEGVPLAVTSSTLKGPQFRNLDSMADVACCSYEARSAGVRNGMRMGSALQICPNLVAVPYEFDKYRTVSKKLYEIASSYTLALEAVSCDEMYIDCTSILREADCSPVDLAEHIREEIRKCTGCNASAGLGGNRILARLATRKAKPNGIFHLEPAMIEDFMKDVPLKDLPGIGPMLNSKLKELNLHVCGELQTLQLSKLENEFGPHTGKRLYNNCRGLESTTQKEGHVQERKSVSSEINYGIRFTEFVQAEETLKKMSKIVSSKLSELKGKCITLKIKVRSPDAPAMSAKFLGHGICDSICRASSLDHPTSDPDVIAKVSTDLLRKSNVVVSDLRGLGVMVSKLERVSQKQKIESISQYFNNPIPKGSSSAKAKEKRHYVKQKSTEHAEKYPQNAVSLLGNRNVRWVNSASDNFCPHRPKLDNIVEEMEFMKLVRNHFESFICTGRIPDGQFKNTILCILLNEVHKLNIASALRALKELNRLSETVILDSEKRKWWTILLEKISRKVHKSISKVIQ